MSSAHYYHEKQNEKRTPNCTEVNYKKQIKTKTATTITTKTDSLKHLCYEHIYIYACKILNSAKENI